MNLNSARARKAFTLIELLTVIFIIFIIAAIVVGIAYNANTKAVSANGSTAVVGWMKTAQAYALRDQKPYGVRFDLSSNHVVTLAQYVEQPPDWLGPTGGQLKSTSTGATAVITIPPAPSPQTDFSNGFANAVQYPIQARNGSIPGDYLEFGDSNVIGEITAVTPTSLTVNLWPPDTTTNNAAWNATSANWRIIRQPRAMIGSDPLNLPGGAVIDTDISFFNPPAPQYQTNLPIQNNSLTILFSPHGGLVGFPGMARLWVRDGTQPILAPGVFQGDQFVVSVNGMTGMVGIQPIDVRSAGANQPYTDPYTFTKDGKGSGY